MSIEHLFEELTAPQQNVENLIIIEMIRDLKKILNPLFPMPMKIGIIRTWMHYICCVKPNCVDPRTKIDDEVINRVVADIMSYVYERAVQRTRKYVSEGRLGENW